MCCPTAHCRPLSSVARRSNHLHSSRSIFCVNVCGGDRTEVKRKVMIRTPKVERMFDCLSSLQTSILYLSSSFLSVAILDDDGHGVSNHHGGEIDDNRLTSSIRSLRFSRSAVVEWANRRWPFNTCTMKWDKQISEGDKDIDERFSSSRITNRPKPVLITKQWCSTVKKPKSIFSIQPVKRTTQVSSKSIASSLSLFPSSSHSWWIYS